MSNLNPPIIFDSVKKIEQLEEKANDAISKAGGTLTGSLVTKVTKSLKSYSDTSYVTIAGDTYKDLNGTMLALYGCENSGNKGKFRIRAGDGTNKAELVGTPSGTLTWDSSKVVTEASGVASSATKLATARNINGVAFDGTSDITISGSDNTKLPLAGGTVTNTITSTTLNPVIKGDGTNWVRICGGNAYQSPELWLEPDFKNDVIFKLSLSDFSTNSDQLSCVNRIDRSQEEIDENRPAGYTLTWSKNIGCNYRKESDSTDRITINTTQNSVIYKKITGRTVFSFEKISTKFGQNCYNKAFKTTLILESIGMGHSVEWNDIIWAGDYEPEQSSPDISQRGIYVIDIYQYFDDDGGYTDRIIGVFHNKNTVDN